MSDEPTLPPDFSLAPAVRRAYAAGQEDEALEPIVAAAADGGPVGRIGPGDSVIFYDVRGEREVELTQALTEPAFAHFPVRPLGLDFVTLIEYRSGLRVRTAFPPEAGLKNTLAEVFSAAGFSVRKIAESEKAIHVAYFFNGKREEAFPGEERRTVPSPAVANYAETPAMNAAGVVEQVRAALAGGGPRLVVANLANVDVVGHIVDRDAVAAAVRSVDAALGSIVEDCRRAKATLVVTADHGTVEEWLYPDGQVNTGHTKNPVPFVIADFAAADPSVPALRPAGELADVAPTILGLAGLPQPAEMTGASLLASPPSGPHRTRIVLLILDGWGLRDDPFGNLIAETATPHFDRLWSSFPRSILASFGEAVGMPAKAVGNSEAGHLHLGAGRRVLLDRVRIDKSIEDGSFERNEALAWAMDEASRKGRALHLLGIVSFYSSHGTLQHLFALLRMARRRNVPRVYVHGLIGRRGELPESGAIYVEKVEQACREIGAGRLVTVIGRFWALDREENWDRVEKTVRALVDGAGERVRAGT